MEGYYAEDGVQLFFISSEDRRKKQKTREAGIASGEIGVRAKEAGPGGRVMRRWNEQPRMIMKSPSLEFWN